MTRTDYQKMSLSNSGTITRRCNYSPNIKQVSIETKPTDVKKLIWLGWKPVEMGGQTTVPDHRFYL
jgi:hypothetical protein